VPIHRFDTHRRGASEQAGFTLIEVLVVILIIGILAAIAIPSFLNQSHKAQDSQAKVIARDAQLAIETYATNNSGSYSGADVAALTAIDPTLAGTGSNTASLISVTGANASNYTVIASDPGTSNQFSVVKTGSAISRLCSGSGGGCSGGSW
jgi:type IV pilus assembly protein PilA